MTERQFSPIQIDELFGKHALGTDRPQDYIAWAVQQLVAGVESPALAILAGLDLSGPVDSAEVRQWFGKVTDELGLEWPDEEQSLRVYSRLLCRQILSEALTPDEGLTRLSKIWPATGYTQQMYAIWDELGEDISLLDTSIGPIFNSGLSAANSDDYIRKVAAQFLRLLGSELPDDFFRLVYCRDCRQIDQPETTRVALPWLPERLYRLIFRRGPAYEWACAGCGSKELLTMRDYVGREKFLESLSGHHQE